MKQIVSEGQPTLGNDSGMGREKEDGNSEGKTAGGKQGKETRQWGEGGERKRIVSEGEQDICEEMEEGKGRGRKTERVKRCLLQEIMDEVR